MHGADVPPPRYREFVAVHVDSMGPGMAWGVHLMPGMGPEMGRNFLAWHRQFIAQFEHRLQAASASVALPYWDWIENPESPAALRDPAMLERWSVKRAAYPFQGRSARSCGRAAPVPPRECEAQAGERQRAHLRLDRGGRSG